MLGLKIVYILNIIIAGWVGITSLLFPKITTSMVFTNAYNETPVFRLAGALWLSIAVLSALGLRKPITFSPVLLIQLLYKSSCLLIVALPSLINGTNFPRAIAVFFLILVIVLPFVIPWKDIFSGA